MDLQQIAIYLNEHTPIKSIDWHLDVHGFAQKDNTVIYEYMKPNNVNNNYACKVYNYEELHRISNNIANYINYLDSEKNKKIVIFGNRSAILIATIFGILKSGSAYSIIDTCHPTNRLVTYLTVLKPDMCILCDYDIDTYLSKYFKNIIRLPNDISLVNSVAYTLPDSYNTNNSTAIYTFTSGSTGIPKCVMGKHSSLTVFYPAMRHLLNIDSHLTYGMLSGISHDPLQRDIFTPIYFGSSIHIPPQKILLNSTEITDWLQYTKVNIICVTPSLLQIILAPKKKLTHLTHVFSVGEKLFKKDAIALFQLAPSCKIINMYGSTETQRAVSMYIVTKNIIETDPILQNLDVIPSGKGVGPVNILVICTDLIDSNINYRLANINEEGEIYIQSPYISKGYYEQLEETHKKFVINPITGEGLCYRTGDIGKYLPDGNMLCTGRTDNQVKIRGYRVELDEIDTCLSTLTGVHKSITLYQNDLLITWVKSQIHIQELYNHLKSNLPHYMVPDHIVPVQEFFINHNCKIDVTKLPDYTSIKPNVTHNINDILLDAIEHIRHIIGLVDGDTNLLECGLSSYNIAELVSYINQKWNQNYKIIDFYKSPKLSDFLGINKIQSIDLLDEIQTYKQKISNLPFNNMKLIKSKFTYLLTGVTGFLGSHLLVDLLERSDVDSVICVIRGQNDHDIYNKLKNTIIKYHSETIFNKITTTSKINMVIGDITLPHFGMNDTIWTYLLQHVNSIIHNAAEVDWVKSYHQLKTANVDSTMTCIEFAFSAIHKTSINFISSTAIYDTSYFQNLQIIQENQSFDTTVVNELTTGYAQTKMISDILVGYVRKYNISTNVYRTSYLICDTKNYNWISRDFLVKMLQYVVKTGTIPYDTLQPILYLLPVDIASHIIVSCSLNETNHDFNIVGKSIGFSDYLNICNYYLPINIIGYQKWITNISNSDQEIKVLVDFIPNPSTYKPRYYDTNTSGKYCLCNMIDLHNIISKYIRKDLLEIKIE